MQTDGWGGVDHQHNGGIKIPHPPQYRMQNTPEQAHQSPKQQASSGGSVDTSAYSRCVSHKKAQPQISFVARVKCPFTYA